MNGCTIPTVHAGEYVCRILTSQYNPRPLRTSTVDTLTPTARNSTRYVYGQDVTAITRSE